ncbi:MAG: FG-GAP repeat domain-containing protein [Polyangiales bacterium]
MRRLPFLALGLSAAVLVPAFARADWPIARHDAQRTAFASGASSIKQPTQYWQTYVGGSLAATSHIALDVNKDGTTDVVYLAGGKAIAKLPDDRLVWESQPVELTQLHGVVDLDGDGGLEVIASSARNVFVLSGATGAVLWTEPEGEVGNVGAVRIADLDGDKKPEIVIDDCGCCGISPTASPPGGIYKFTKLDSPTKLGTPSTRGHCGGQALTVGDFDGDGSDDLAYGDPAGYLMVSGKTSASLGVSDPVGLGTGLYYSRCESANVDGRTGDELICYQDTYLASSSIGGRVLSVLTYDAAASPTLKTLWKVGSVPKASGRLVSVGNSLVDLDADGKLEIVVAWSSDGVAFDTTIYDAKSGAVLGTIPGENLVALIDLDGDKRPEIVTRGSAGTTARKYDRAGAPSITSFGSFAAGLSVPTQLDWSRASKLGPLFVPITLDLAGDGKVLPVLVSSTAGASKYQATKFAADATATAAATFTVPDGVSILTNQVFDKVNRGYPQLLLTRNDGYLLVLDKDFAPTNSITVGSGEFKMTLPGMRVGGFIPAPIAPRLDGAADAVVVTDSRGVLERLDASKAWMAKPPTVSWEFRGGHDPTTAKNIAAGAAGLVCAKGSSLTALDGTGKTLWETPMPSGGTVSYDTLATDVNGDGVTDPIAAYLTSGGVLNIQAYSGKDGTALWGAPVSEALQWGWYPFSLADHDGDGVLDVYAVLNTLRVHSGKSGTKLAENATFIAYFTPVIADVDGDGTHDVTMSRGYFPARTFKKDLTTALWTGGDDRPYQHGARATCSGKQIWVQPSSQYKGMVRFHAMDGSATSTLYLAGGKSFAKPADAAGSFLGTLGDVSIKQDLVGGGDHPSALVGSTDGFLYALDPCKIALDWAYDLRFGVGNPILADTDGDGTDEILVGAADGYLHAVGPRVLEAPTGVNDNDPYGAVPGPDVDKVATADRLAGSWNAVTGADAYQIAVLTEGGTYVTQPDWVDVGNVTNYKATGISLSLGKKYFWAVRAISKTKGSSPETRSNGVIVEAPVAPDGGLGDAMLGDDGGITDTDGGADGSGLAPDEGGKDGSGCGCRVAQSPNAGALASLAAIGLLARRRRRRA